MPTLNWIGKDAVINHHLEVPFRLLKDVPELGCGDPGSGNLIVEGDNLVALKALLPYYKGKVKCICIDPLYNGILKDKSVDGGNVLTSTTLEHLPAHDGPKVVYAAGCRFSKARLEREGITFKQTPYAIRTK